VANTSAQTWPTVCKLRQHRAVATRYDKRDFVWGGTVNVASIRIWLHDPVT
jgi:hypothetical protein